MSSPPLISIVTVCRNSDATIEDALRSVDAQSWPHIEHIVVDGASTDGTHEIVQAYSRRGRQAVSEPRPRHLRRDEQGLGPRARGLRWFPQRRRHARGPRASAARGAACRTGCEALYSDLVYVSAGDTARVVRRWRSGSFTRGALASGWMPPHPTFYVGRSVLERVGRFDASLSIAADYEFMLRVLMQPEITVAQVPGVLVHMRTGGASNRSVSALWRKSREDLRRHAAPPRRRTDHVAVQEHPQDSPVPARPHRISFDPSCGLNPALATLRRKSRDPSPRGARRS